MRIAIASQGKTLDSQTAANAGRAPYYLIVDDGELQEVMDNPFSQGGGGAGPKVARMIADKEVDMVALEQLGSNMEMALEDKGIKIKKVAPGKVSDALRE